MRRLLLLVAVIALVIFAVSRCSGGGAPRDIAVVIPPGSSLTAAASVLERTGAIGSADSFLTRAKLFGSKDPIKPGEQEWPRLSTWLGATTHLTPLVPKVPVGLSEAALPDWAAKAWGALENTSKTPRVLRKWRSGAARIDRTPSR